MAHHEGLLDREAVAGRELPRPGGCYAGLDPRVRLGMALLVCVAVVAMQSLAALVTAMILAMAALAAARPRLAELGPRLLAIEGFMAMIIVMLPFTVPAADAGDVLFHWGPLAASGSGLRQAMAIVLKTNTVVLVLAALVAGMEPHRFGRALAAFGLPARLVTLMLVTVRYLDVLQRDYARLRRSMRVRGFRARANRHSLRSIGYLVGMLLVRSFDRAERILAAMKCRGFDGTFRLETLAPPGRGDALLAVGTLLALGACLVVEFATR